MIVIIITKERMMINGKKCKDKFFLVTTYDTVKNFFSLTFFIGFFYSKIMVVPWVALSE